MMEYRQLGDSDLQVSEICLGTGTTFGESAAQRTHSVGRLPGGRVSRSSSRRRSAARCPAANASVIVGASRPGQLRDNAAASGVDLDDETMSAIEDAVAA